MSTLPSLPEELLDRVLSYCVVTPLPPSSRSSRLRSPLSIFLVSKTFYRVSTPLFYHTIYIRSSKQLHTLISLALRRNRILVNYIQRIVLADAWAEAGELFIMCNKTLLFLDITLDSAASVRERRFCTGLLELTSLTHIVIRKPVHSQLVQPRPQYILSQLAKAIQRWEQLVRFLSIRQYL